MAPEPPKPSAQRTVGDLFDMLLQSPDAASGQFGGVLALVPLEPWEVPLTPDDLQVTQTGNHMVLRTAIGRQAPAFMAKPFAIRRLPRLELGRGREVVIRIDQPTVSRVHAELVLQGEQYEIFDRDSRNGTLVNGRILDPDERVLLNDGDVIGLGEAQLLYGSLEHFAVLARGRP